MCKGITHIVIAVHNDQGHIVIAAEPYDDIGWRSKANLRSRVERIIRENLLGCATIFPVDVSEKSRVCPWIIPFKNNGDVTNGKMVAQPSKFSRIIRSTRLLK